MASKGMQISTALHTLRLDKSATEESVKLAYRELAKMWHPDKYRDGDPMKPEADRQIKMINEAKAVALTYIKKYGHFLHVKEAPFEAPPRRAPPEPPHAQEKPPQAKHQEYRQEQAYQAPPNQEANRSRPKPEPEPAPTSEPASAYPGDFDEKATFSDLIPSQTTLVALFVITAITVFMFTMIQSLLDSPADRLKAYTEKAVVQPRVNPVLKKKLIEPETEEPTQENSEDQDVVEAEQDTFFTIGSNKDWVSKVQGYPLQIKGAVWRYGFSTITFSADTVVGWKNSELNPMKVGIITDPNVVYPYSTFDIGSDAVDVVALQGPPDVIVDSLWSFGDAQVVFSKGKVISWINDMQNRLHVQ